MGQRLVWQSLRLNQPYDVTRSSTDTSGGKKWPKSRMHKKWGLTPAGLCIQTDSREMCQLADLLKGGL